ncbi:alpha-E domain-containing protein [Leptothoe kymatousa]|uniref:Alpha-E domain-containing protein n=1 Tax=Leptothoe kymatousa TAU-MAC 1615 TaxID=2364775 RepID=A0ABS5Y531_9CYAN|nr:alpha-E domain-containing protein [Leptothoe kymatousa]MBT9312736.1 alpha-E domain-containing protein [Leptothoe kymatousa TAU-MAC 1615]
MLSRVANSIYWANRYVERAENVSRFVDVNLNLLLDTPMGTMQQWEPLVVTTGDQALFKERYGEATAENVLKFLTFDAEYPNSIRSCVKLARENARSVREIISSEMWEQLNEFYLQVEDAAKSMDMSKLYAFYPEVKNASHMFAGVMNATMSHNEGWHFGLLGRYLERADKTARILDVKYFILLPSLAAVGSPLDNLQWIALLRSASAYEMYSKCQHMINPRGVVDFLVLNPEFPRSIRCCILEAEKSLHKISGTPAGSWRLSSERRLGKLRSHLEYITLEEIFEIGLHEVLDRLQDDLNHVGSAITENFFGLPVLA